MKWLPYVYGGIIFIISSIPRLDAHLPEIIGIDKMLHFIEYLIFGLLVFKYYRKNNIVYLFLFATADEFHQKFIPGRYVSIYDLIFNFTGLFFAYICKK